jgi:hypothetical protein
MFTKSVFMLAALSTHAFSMMPEDGSPMPEAEPGTAIIQMIPENGGSMRNTDDGSAINQ